MENETANETTSQIETENEAVYYTDCKFKELLVLLADTQSQTIRLAILLADDPDHVAVGQLEHEELVLYPRPPVYVAELVKLKLNLEPDC